MSETIYINDPTTNSNQNTTHIIVESADYIIIDIDVFIQHRKQYITPIDSIQSKADNLHKTYLCFQENDTRNFNNSYGTQHNDSGDLKSSRWVRNNISKNVNVSLVRSEKVKIGANGKELSKEDRMKREFMSFINRLSDNNRKNINTYFQTNLQIDFIDIYIRLVWEAMLRSENFQHLYIDCFEAIYTQAYNNNSNISIDGQLVINTATQSNKPELFKSKINLLSKTYFDNEKWIPNKELIEEEDYDDFCDFVKWKKTSITYIHGFSKFVNKDWLNVSLYTDLSTNLIDSLKKYLNEIPEGCKVSDALLDQLMILVEYTKTDQDKFISSYIKTLNDNAQQYRPSTRFKIYDIKEILDKKNKYIVKNLKN